MKKLLSIVLVAAMVMALGCTAFADGTEITYWSMWNEGEPQATVIAEAAEAYEAETGVHVNIEWKGRDLNSQLQAALDAEDSFDIFEDDYNRIANTYNNEKILDLTDMAEAAGYADHSYPVLNQQVVNWVGYLNSIVEQPQIGGFFYDKAAFEAAGIEGTPTTWDEFLDVCAKLKEAGIAPIAQDSAYTNINFYYLLVRYLGEDGVAELRDNGGWAENEKAVQAAQDIIDLVNAGYFADGTPDEYPSGQNKIGLGLAAMAVCGQYLTTEVDANLDTSVDWGMFNYPAVEGGADPDAIYVGSNSLAITAFSEHPQEAFDFIMFLVTGEYDQKMAAAVPQIPADPSTEAPASMSDARDLLLTMDDNAMSWCGSLNTHPAWSTMKGETIPKLFEGQFETGADFCAAMDALYE